jgi:hypothetical protein
VGASGRIKDMHGRGFDEGSTVLLTLHSPREKFFGVLVKLAAAGVELRGIPLESLDDLARQLRAGERAGASTLFFPMHRVERIELDAPAGELPSLGESFAAKAGRAVQEVFGENGVGESCP